MKRLLIVLALLLSVGAAHADDTARIQAMINSGGCVCLPPGTVHVTTLIMRPGVTMDGSGADTNGVTGTQIIGTPGLPTITFAVLPHYSPYTINHLSISGGSVAIATPTSIITQVHLNDVTLNGTLAGFQQNGNIEELQMDQVIFQSGQYGYQQLNGYLQRDVLVQQRARDHVHREAAHGPREAHPCGVFGVRLAHGGHQGRGLANQSPRE